MACGSQKTLCIQTNNSQVRIKCSPHAKSTCILFWWRVKHFNSIKECMVQGMRLPITCVTKHWYNFDTHWGITIQPPQKLFIWWDLWQVRDTHNISLEQSSSWYGHEKIKDRMTEHCIYWKRGWTPSQSSITLISAAIKNLITQLALKNPKAPGCK